VCCSSVSNLKLPLLMLIKHSFNFLGLASLAAFGYVMATHLSLYPAILIIPVSAATSSFFISKLLVKIFNQIYHLLSSLGTENITLVQVILLLRNGPDAPPPKVFMLKASIGSIRDMPDKDKRDRLRVAPQFSWKPVVHFIFWLFIWSCYVLLLSSIVLKKVGSLHEMFEK
jgi:GPI-anchor transamidase subunit U